MRHYFDINPAAFHNILEGTKEFELRLRDEETKGLDVGDTIVIENFDNRDEKLEVAVEAILYYKNYRALFEDIDYNRCGPKESLEAKMQGIYRFYSPEQEEKYGVMAIKLNLMKRPEDFV